MTPGCVILGIMYKGWEVLLYLYLVFDTTVFELAENNWKKQSTEKIITNMFKGGTISPLKKGERL